jgi:large subunit ribosomal protein L9
MKIILTQEVTGLGSAGDILEVKDGYGRNYLLPRGYAIRWTKGAEKEVVSIRRARQSREIRDVDQADEVATRLADLNVRLSARAGSGGRLFGSVTTADIVEAVRAAGGPELDRRRVELPEPIKSTGSHQVRVRLHPEVSVTFDVAVLPAGNA